MQRLDADLMGSVFGTTFRNVMGEAILVIGKDTWDRFDLADMGIVQMKAARIVSDLAKEYRAKNTADLYNKVGPASLASNTGVGLHSFYVLWRAFEAKELDPNEWYAKGREGAVVTFLSVKHRAARDLAREKKARPRRAQIALDEAKAKRSNGKS